MLIKCFAQFRNNPTTTTATATIAVITIIIYLDEYPYTLPLEATVQLIR